MWWSDLAALSAVLRRVARMVGFIMHAKLRRVLVPVGVAALVAGLLSAPAIGQQLSV